VARARVGRIGADFLRGEAQRIRANRRQRHRRREGGLILAPLHAAAARAGFRVGEDHHVEVWRLAKCTAQCCGERFCGHGVLFAFPSVCVRDGAKTRYVERAETVPRKVIGLEKRYECGEFGDEGLRWRRGVHDIQEWDEGVLWAT
jgi:hypothetical protein